jgi:hypothetical protein
MKLQPYEFEFVGTQENSYIFETDNQIFYELAFKLFDYFFTDTRYAHKAYEFRIDVLWTSLEKLPDIFKFDVVLRDKKGEDIPISMLIQSNNPHLGNITEEFRKVIGGYHK